MIRAVFLDIDDTLLDFGAFVRNAMRSGFQHFGLPAYEESMYPVFQRINGELWRGIERGEIRRSQLVDLRWPAIFRELNIDGDGRAFEFYFRDALLHSAIPMPGADEIVPWLSERFLLCAASNGPYHQQETRLKLAGYLPYFHHLFISESLGVSKPAPAFFSSCIRILNESAQLISSPILPEEILMVGDSPSSDLAGGSRSGLKTCYYDPRHQPLPEGTAPDHVIHHLRQLRELLTP